MFSNWYRYCLILWCCVSAYLEITALFAYLGSDNLMELETEFAYLLKSLVSHCNIIDVDAESLCDGGSFETPQDIIAFIELIRKAVVNVLYICTFIIIIVIIILVCRIS